jgi:hypothetical protein
MNSTVPWPSSRPPLRRRGGIFVGNGHHQGGTSPPFQQIIFDKGGGTLQWVGAGWRASGPPTMPARKKQMVGQGTIAFNRDGISQCGASPV